MRFEFATAARIIFGTGVLAEVTSLAGTLGHRCFVMGGRDLSRLTPLLSGLAAGGMTCRTFATVGEPSAASVRDGLQRALDFDPDVVIGMGGGSAIDAAKAVAVLATNGGDPMDYMEVVGRGLPLARPGLPCIAIPTTAGTGAEVTRNAVIVSDQGVKASLRGHALLPRYAVVDPELTLGLPRHITAATGLDALTQLIEPFTCIRPNPLTDQFCREGMTRVARSLRRACEQPTDAGARLDMALASLLGGLALANAGLGAAHGFAGPIGGRFTAPHGAVCAALLPHVMAANVEALLHEDMAEEKLARYDEAARLLTGNSGATALDGIKWVESLCADLGIPGLSAYGITEADIPALVEITAVASSTKANPVAHSREALAGILARAL